MHGDLHQQILRRGLGVLHDDIELPAPVEIPVLSSSYSVSDFPRAALTAIKSA
jgi:hypothetical protein